MTEDEEKQKKDEENDQQPQNEKSKGPLKLLHKNKSNSAKNISKSSSAHKFKKSSKRKTKSSAKDSEANNNDEYSNNENNSNEKTNNNDKKKIAALANSRLKQMMHESCFNAKDEKVGFSLKIEWAFFFFFGFKSELPHSLKFL